MEKLNEPFLSNLSNCEQGVKWGEGILLLSFRQWIPGKLSVLHDEKGLNLSQAA